MKIFRIAMWLIGMVLSLVEPPAIAQSTSADSPYVEVFFYSGPRITGDNQIGSATCNPSTPQACRGLYALLADGSSSIRGGDASRLGESKYELLYDFSLETYRDSLLLIGQFYSLQLDGQGTIIGGRKVPINQAVQFDSPQELHFKTVGEQQLTVQYFVRNGWGRTRHEEIAYGSNTITVKSTCWTSGNTSKTGNTQPLVWDKKEKIRLYGSLDAPWEFPAEFTTAPRGRHDEALSYRVTISFDPPIRSGNYPLRTVMELSRQYWLDTAHTVNQPINRDRGTGSVYRKEIELVKGKVLKLVFPPDNESLRSFRVEDTVIINP